MKKQINLLLNSLVITALTVFFFACSKTDNTTVSEALFSVGANVSTGAPLKGSIKGTMLADSVYYIGGDVTINAGDTLLVQRGVKVYFQGNYSFIIRGTMAALGTKDKQIYFTVQNLAKTDVAGTDPLADPAYKGTWGGLLGDSATNALILKWTHVEFGCGTLVKSPVLGIGDNKPAYMISFVNPNGIFVLEDSWIYGGVDDPIRIQGGKVHIMRNTFEKGGLTGGECLNIKSGTVGNIAYNLMIGSATNGIKPSNNGGKNPQTEIVAYNNTIVNSGYRRSADGRGGSINYEEGAKGLFYNNLIINCKYGPRIVPSDANYSGNALKGADTARIFYGNNWQYGDSALVVNQMYPVGFYTKPQATDVPGATGLGLPATYKWGDVYDGKAALGKNDPQFVNYPLPQPKGKLADYSYATGFDFRLKTTSPALGKGTKGFTLLNVVPVSATFGATLVSQPSTDLGAYPADGSGNQH